MGFWHVVFAAGLGTVGGVVALLVLGLGAAAALGGTFPKR